ncbi:cytochrome-c oxidase, cbb3-type subunit I [soil metagenome]
MTAEKSLIHYDDKTVRHFLIATVVWSLVAMLVGVVAALQLSFWQVNGKFLEAVTFGLFKGDGLEYITFGRLRPLHTNAAIFAFVGNMMFAGIYYSTQRLCKARTPSDLLSKIHFWGWQLIIVLAAITLPLGYTRGKEYAELIWPINILVAVVWVVFGWNFFWTLKRRNEPSLYVALWFYIATIVTVAMLYIVNHLSLPTSLVHSYPIFGGVQDALVQWWYGHNAVAFFLTTPILGIMYYFLPKAAERPVYSYRLSIVHFWSLVFLYIWAGPHHLLNTALPQWLQMLGVFFSLMLWAPSWGGMLNGLLTLRGAWDKLRTDPVIKFYVVAITFYGMATFEGPLLAVRAVNALSHYSDWTIGHVHSGTLGWNGFMAAGMIYWLVPRLWGRELRWKNLPNIHFWIGLVGILLYVASMWVAGVTQGLMLNATTDDGTLLRTTEFVETVEAISALMFMRSVGGALYLAGFVLLAANVFATIRGARPVDGTAEVTLLHKVGGTDKMSLWKTFRNDPVAYALSVILFVCLWFFLPPYADVMALICALILSAMTVATFKRSKGGWAVWYERLLENWMPFTVLTLVAVLIGGVIQIIPTVTVSRAHNIEDRLQVLYSPLELEGRDLFVSEGCYNCHSQMIRTLVPDVLRYGDYSRLGESIFDHPFQWGSKRTGPDLAREGGKRGNIWHFQHMLDPRKLVEKSRMPAYPWLFEKETDFKSIPGKIAAQRRLGVPYPAMTRDEIQQHALEQALAIKADLESAGAYIGEDKQILPLIAYLQKLGTFRDPAAGQDPLVEAYTPVDAIPAAEPVQDPAPGPGIEEEPDRVPPGTPTAPTAAIN